MARRPSIRTSASRRNAAAVFRAVSDPTRRAILDSLRAGPRAAGAIADAFPVSRPAISRHLRVLRHASLVREEKRGRERLYALNPEPLKAIDDWLTAYRLHWTSALLALKQHVEDSADAASPSEPRP